MPILRRVLAVVPKADDLEVHICQAVLAGVTVLDIRDFVPSTCVYGRGTTLPWKPKTFEIMSAAIKNKENA